MVAMFSVFTSKKVFYKRKAVAQTCSVKKVFLEISQNSQENTCARVSFLIAACNFIKKETLAQVFPCEFCKISKNNFFTEHFWVTVVDLYLYHLATNSH